jgi:hypothetical protein
MRVHRVSDLLEVRLVEEGFERLEDFDLEVFWKAWCAGREAGRSAYTATVRIAPNLLSLLPQYFGSRIRERIAQAGEPDAEGWITLELPFESLFAARDRLLGFGSAVEVLAPRALRLSIQDVAEQVVQLYARR